MFWPVNVYCIIVIFKSKMIIYDSDCRMCRGWASRWGKFVNCVPNIPEYKLPVDRVYYIMTDGCVLSGAAAVLEVESKIGFVGRSLAFFYNRFLGVRLILDAIYFFVARRRSCGQGGVCRLTGA